MLYDILINSKLDGRLPLVAGGVLPVPIGVDLKDGLPAHPARPRHVLLDEHRQQPRVDEEQDRLHQLPLPVIHILQAYLGGLLYEWERYQDLFLTTAKKPHQEDHQVLNKEKRTNEEILKEAKDTGQES